MSEELAKTLGGGLYRPTFFNMEIGHEADMGNLENLPDEPSAIYLHEYVHFLQDITTTYGLSNIAAVVDFIKYANGIILKRDIDTFCPPIKPTPSAHNTVSFNQKLKPKYIGNQEPIRFANIAKVTKQKETVTLQNGNVEVEKIILDYIDNRGNLAYYQFGAHCILESMAYLVENSVYPDLVQRPPDFPYKAAQKVVENEYPSFGENLLNVLALCDVSLGVFNPGEFFYTMLQKMRDENYLPIRPEEIYGYCASKVSFQFSDATNLNQLFLILSNMAREGLQDYFTTPNLSGAKRWVGYTIAAAFNIRLTNPFFILNIAQSGKIQSNVPFIGILNELGTPMVTNLRDELTFYSPIEKENDIRPEFLWAINQIYELVRKPLVNTPQKCKMKKWCKASCHEQNQPDFTNAHCDDSPWLRVNDERLCAFATMWKTWGLEGYTPI
jgi:hypothetical protein